MSPLVEDASSWTTGQRMRRFLAEAMPLGKDAIAAALADARLPAEGVGMFAVASCTGYTTPGIDILLARDVGMAADVRRVVIGHMGCYAALPTLGVAADYVVAHGRPAVVLCLELPSLHVQPPTAGDLEQLVAHALFADAAVAVVLAPDGPGLTVVDTVAATDPTTADHMTWEITDNGFRLGLSPRVPDVLAGTAGGVVSGLLAKHGLAPSEVDGWAVHPGGPRILEAVRSAVGLPTAALGPSYGVLRDYGNCSSPTVLLVLDRLRTCDTVVLTAFGPGLTLCAALLTRR